MTDPADRAAALTLEGEAHYREGRLAEAQASYRAAIALAPSMRRLHNLATVHQTLGDYAQSEALFRQALALDPENPRVRASLGIGLLAQGRLTEGFAFYDSWRRIPEVAAKAAPVLPEI